MACSEMVRPCQARNMFFLIFIFLFVNGCMGQIMNWKNDQNADTIVPAPGLQDKAEYSRLPPKSNFPHLLFRDPVENMNYRTPERFDYSSIQQQLTNPARFQQFSHQFGQFGQLMHRRPFPNPADFSQFNQPNFFRQSGYPSFPLLRSYRKREEFKNYPDIVAPATQLENNEKYSFHHILDDHQQQAYPEQMKELRYLNPDESPRYSGGSLQQLRNPAYFRAFNQQNPLTQNGHSRDPQLRSNLGESQMNNSHDYSRVRDPGFVPENSAAHFKTTSNQQQTGLSNQTVEHKNINMHEIPNNTNHLLQQNNPEMFHQINQSSQLGKSEQSSELQQHINSTDRTQLNVSDDLQVTAAYFRSLDQVQLKKQEQENQIGNATNENLTEQGNYSSQFQQVNPSENTSNHNFSLHNEQLVNLNESQEQKNSTDDQHLNYTSDSQQSNFQNHSQQLNTEHILKQQNISSQLEGPLNSSETNMTSNQSQLQEHSHIDHFQLKDKSEAANVSANSEQLKPRNNFTGFQQQNYKVSSDKNISASNSENSTAHLQASQLSIRPQRQLDFPSYPSPMQYFFRSSQPQKFNPFNQINKPSLFMKPTDHLNHPSSWIENRQLSYPISPAMCYLEKMHGPCNGIIPSFFYNPVSKHCERFIYGGCLGNANNFATFEECESICMMPSQNGLTEIKYPQQWNYHDVQYEDPALPLWHPGPELVHEFCSLEKRKGPCRAIFRRYFFNSVTQNCEEFIYGGCYGNANNFFTKEECEFVCKSL